jgi:beta-glucanase (GH16 family)
MNRHLLTLIILSLLLVFVLAGCGDQATPVVIEPTPVLPTTTSAPVAIPPTEAPPEPIPTSEPKQPVPVALSMPELPLVDDFETGELPEGQDGTILVGFLTWSGGSDVSIQTVEVGEGDELALPDQVGSNTIVQLNTDISANGWAGFSHALNNETVDAWVPQDWSAYEGISMWLYGNNTGGRLFVDILDNRNPNPAGDDAERFTFNITDDFAGWQYIEIPFSEFFRKDIGNGAPNDGFTLTEVHGYAVGVFGSIAVGQQTNYVDQIKLYGDAGARPVEVKFSETSFSAKETGVATIRLELNKPADDVVSVRYYTIEGDATPGRDFILPGDTVEFEPGEMKQSFKIEIIDDAISEGNEQTLIVLTNPTGAALNPQARAVLTIRDNEPVDADLLLDFNHVPPFISDEGVTLSTIEVPVDSELALPDQLDAENILVVDSQVESSFSRLYAESQDWSEKTGLSFWFYGSNSGDTITMELLDNHTTATDDVLPENWQLIWSDEFDDPVGTMPDALIWQPEIGDGMLNGLTGWGNAELEYYTDSSENTSADGEGNLVITARKIDAESSNLLCWYGPCEYTSARLITRDRLELEYGRVEARIKLPSGQGLWSAFWLLGNNLDEVSWPQSGEIDILENIGREPATAYGTLHGPGYSGSEGIGAGYDLADGNLSDDFYVYAVEWSPDQIRWFIDDTNYFTATPESLPDGTEWVYNHPFFIILNLAVGGNWPGAPDETTTFPQTMQVDYLRVFGSPSTAERFEYRFTDDVEGWTKISIPFDSLKRSPCQPQGAPDDGLTLTDIWGYSFELPAGASFYLDKIRLESE